MKQMAWKFLFATLLFAFIIGVPSVYGIPIGPADIGPGNFWVIDFWDTNGPGVGSDPSAQIIDNGALVDLPGAGVSSLQMASGPGTGGTACARLGGKPFFGTQSLAGARLGDITSLSYSFLVEATSGVAGSQFLGNYINIFVDSDGSGTWSGATDSILIFEPLFSASAPSSPTAHAINGAFTPNAWYTFEAIGPNNIGRWHYAAQPVQGSNINLFTLNAAVDDIWFEIIDNPVTANLQIVNPPGAGCGVHGEEGTQSGLAFVTGQKMGTPWHNHVSRLDNITLAVTGVVNDTFDLEIFVPVVPPPVVVPGPAVPDVVPELGVPDVPGANSNCLDHILRRLESTSFSVSVRCIRRIENPNERPVALEGYAYTSPTYEIEGIRDGRILGRTEANYGKACFVTNGLIHPVFIGYHYDQFPPNPPDWKILQRIDAEGYYCIPFLGKGYLVVMNQTGTPPAAVNPAPPSNPTTSEGIALGNCQVTTRSIMNLRSGPGLGFSVLLEVPYGADGTTLAASARSTDGQWYKVNFNGSEGWLNTGFLSKRGDC